MAQFTDCNRCGARLGSDSSVVGLCGACLLESALHDEPELPSEGLLPGLTAGAIFGPFRIGRLLGKGGMAAVYEAHEAPPLARTVALKVLPREFLHDDTFAHRFSREARVVASLEHPNIVPIYASGIEAGVPWLSMRLFAGGNLGTALSAGGRLDMSRATRVLREIADALDYAHTRGVVHRDVKPTNILLDEAGRPCVCDFGLAHVVQGPAGWTSTGVLVGTPLYMAPEQAAGAAIGRHCDIYSLGVVAYEMLTGAPPFGGSSALGVLHQHVNEPVPIPSRDIVPEPVFAVVQKALAKNPAERWPTASAFATALEDSLNPASRSIAHSRLAAAAAVSMVLIGSGAYYWRTLVPATPPEEVVPVIESTFISALNWNTFEVPSVTVLDSAMREVEPGPRSREQPPGPATNENMAKGDDAPMGDVAAPPEKEPGPSPKPDAGNRETADVKIESPGPPPAPPSRPGEIVVAPRAKRTVNPTYPEIAKAAGIQGNVVLRATVGPDGRVTDVEVTRSVHPVLDEAARRAVLQFEYAPGLRNGTPMTATVDVPVSFRLSE